MQSYITLFWSLFGVTNRKDIHIISVNNLNSSQSTQTTQRVAEIMLIIYHFMAIIVLINMLIAMMSNSFQNIQVTDSSNNLKYCTSLLILCITSYKSCT